MKSFSKDQLRRMCILFNLEVLKIQTVIFQKKHVHCSSVFRILILRVQSVNRIFPLRLLTAGAISLFLNITGAIAPVAPVLNTPLRVSNNYVFPQYSDIFCLCEI